MRLDRKDLQILSVLQREGRISKVALAERVHLSPTPCWERLRRLERDGLIEGYSAVVSPRVLGDSITVFTEVVLASHRREDFTRFEQAVIARAEITECWSLGGGIDYLLKFLVPGIDAYQQLVESLLDQDLKVDRYFTYIVTKPIKRAWGLPLEELATPSD